MLKECRECGQPVAARAKTCPSCGVKKPTATAIEAGLDATASVAFKAAFVIIFFGVLLIGCIAVIAGCGTETTAAPSPPTTEQAATTTRPRTTTTTTQQPTTTTDDRAAYCNDYDTWTAADTEMDALERRHGIDVSTWPPEDVDRLFAAMDRRAAAVERVWAQAPDSATVTSVETACTE